MDKATHKTEAQINNRVKKITKQINEDLKTLAQMAEIEINLTTYVARHTFATTVTLTNGVPIETVSKMLGHIDIKTTQHYAKVIDLKVSKDMQALQKILDEEVK